MADPNIQHIGHGCTTNLAELAQTLAEARSVLVRSQAPNTKVVLVLDLDMVDIVLALITPVQQVQ